MTSPAAVDAARERWAGHPLFTALDVRIEALEPGRARLALYRNDRSVGGIRNSINGGVLATFAEAAAHLCLETVLEPGSRIERTQDVTISYLSSAVAPRTVAEARVLRAGRTSVVAVELSDGEDGHANCSARVSCIVVRDAPA